jgi:hypothetical protein
LVAMGFVHAPAPEPLDWFVFARYEIEVSATCVPARASLKAPWPQSG